MYMGSIRKSSSPSDLCPLYPLSSFPFPSHPSPSSLPIVPTLTMVDAQPFAIWHPPGMSADVKKPASVPIPPVQPQVLNKNVENLVGGIKWGDGFNAVKSTGPISSSRPRIHSISYNRTSVAPQQFHLSTNLPSKTDEDESDSDSEDEVVKAPPVSTRKFSSSSPPKPILSSTPVNGNLTNTRPKPTEKISFTPSRVS